MATENIASFDLDMTAALRQVSSLIASIGKLEAELNDLQKAGKDTTATQAKLAQQTATLDKLLSQETKTVKGTTAQIQALNKVMAETTKATQKQTAAQANLDNSSKKAATSFVTLIGRSKNLGQALSRGAGQLSNLVGGFGLSSMAISSLTNVLAPLGEKLFSFVGQSKAVAEVQQSIADATSAATAEYVNEARNLNALVGPLSDANTSTADRAKLIDEINKRYPEYLDGIKAEDFALGKAAATRKLLNDRLLEGIFIAAQEAEKTKILTKIIENSVKIQQLRAKGVAEDEEAVQGLASTVVAFGQIAANPINAIDGIADATDNFAKSVESLDLLALKKEQAELQKQNQDLDKTFKQAAADVKALNLDLGANTALTKEVTSATGKLDKQLEKTAKGIAKLNEELAADLEKNYTDLANSTEPLTNSLAALRSALSAIDKQLNEQTATKDFVKFAQLKKEGEELRIEIEKIEFAIDQLGKKPIEIKAEADLSAFEKGVEQASLALADLRLEQARADLKRQREENAALQRVRGNAAAENAVKLSYAKQNEQAKREQAIATLRLQENLALAELALIKNSGELFSEEAKKAEAEVVAIQTELAKLAGEDYTATVKVKADTSDAKKKLKEQILQVADFVQTLSDSVADFAQTSAADATAELSEAVDKQKELLNQLLSNTETANVEQVRLEQERLDNLQKERKKAAEQEAIIIKLQIAANLALAVARAVVEGGPAAPFTVAAAVLAAIVGFAAAQRASAQAVQGFAEGSLYVDDRRAPHGKDTIPAKLDRGEAVIPKAQNKAYHPMVKAIFNKEIPAQTLNKLAALPAEVLNDFIENQSGGGHVSDSIEAPNTGLKITALAGLKLSKIKAAYAKEGRAGAAQNGGGSIDLARALTYIGKVIAEQPAAVLSGSKLHKVVQGHQNNISKMRSKARPNS